MFYAIAAHNLCKAFDGLSSSLTRRALYRPTRYTRPSAPLNGEMLDRHASGLSLASTALDNISFFVEPGEIFGVQGPAGSGKTTLLRLLATLLRSDGGEAWVFGFPVTRRPEQVRRMINYTSFSASFFKGLSPLENLCYLASQNGSNGHDLQPRAADLLERLGIDPQQQNAPLGELPRSALQKVFIACALLSSPRLLLLDDPGMGLDSPARYALHSAIREARQAFGVTVLLATSDDMEAQALCDRTIRLEHGQVQAAEPIACGDRSCSQCENQAGCGLFPHCLEWTASPLAA